VFFIAKLSFFKSLQLTSIFMCSNSSAWLRNIQLGSNFDFFFFFFSAFKILTLRDPDDAAQIG